MKKNIGTVLALYPTPLVVVGTMVDGKPKHRGQPIYYSAANMPHHPAQRKEVSLCKYHLWVD